MCKPAYKALPWCAKLAPPLLCKLEAAVLVALKHLRQLLGGARVDNYGILLVVEVEASRVEIGAAHGAELAVYHYYLGVMKARLVYIHVYAMLHKLVHVVENAVGCKRNVAVCRNHNLHLYATLYSLLKSLLKLVV